MISHTTSISSFGNRKSIIKDKDYEELHYFDKQSDDESNQEKTKSRSKNKKENDYSSSDNESKEDNFFECDKDSLYETNEKVIDKSPDGNYGKVYNIYNNIKK